MVDLGFQLGSWSDNIGENFSDSSQLVAFSCVPIAFVVVVLFHFSSLHKSSFITEVKHTDSEARLHGFEP